MVSAIFVQVIGEGEAVLATFLPFGNVIVQADEDRQAGFSQSDFVRLVFGKGKHDVFEQGGLARAWVAEDDDFLGFRSALG